MKSISRAVEVHLHLDKTSDAGYQLMLSDMSEYGYIYTGISKSVEVSLELPEDFDPTLAEINCLKREKDKILAEAQCKATRLEERIQQLQCIEYKP